MEHSDDGGKLLLRLLVGGLLALHGIHKILYGPGVGQAVAAAGWPHWVTYGVYIGEVVGPALIIFGFFTRLGGLFVLFNMGIAVYLAHSGDVLTLNQHGGWAIELEAFFGLGALAVMLLGAGRYSFGGANGALN